MDHKWLNLGPTLLFLGLMSAEGHLKLALAVPGSPWAGPYDPVGALYGRRGHGRLRRPRMHIPGKGKGLTPLAQRAVLLLSSASEGDMLGYLTGALFFLQL